jgi:hypothetical protein
MEMKTVNTVIAADAASGKSSSGNSGDAQPRTVSQEYHMRDKKEMKEFGKIQQLKVCYIREEKRGKRETMRKGMLTIGVYSDVSGCYPWLGLLVS